jgi:hypothetical protein
MGGAAGSSGASGSTNGGSGGSAGAGAGGAAGSGTTAFCNDEEKHILCDDFEAPPLTGKWTGQVTSSGGTVSALSLNGNTVFRADVGALAVGGANAYLRTQHTLSPTPSISVSFDLAVSGSFVGAPNESVLQVDTSPEGGKPLTSVGLYVKHTDGGLTLGTFAVSQGTGGFGIVTKQVPGAISFGTKARISLKANFTAPSSGVIVLVEDLEVMTLPFPPLSPQIGLDVQLGLKASAPALSLTAFFDNVLIDAP